MSRALFSAAIIAAILSTVDGDKVIGAIALFQGLFALVVAYVEEYHSEKSSHTNMDS